MLLLDYDLNKTEVQLDEPFRLTPSYWQRLERMDASYTVFTYVQDAQGQVWAQKDGLPAGGSRPTTGWGRGEVIRDEYELFLGSIAPPGVYAIEVGMYVLSTSQRSPVFDERERMVGNRRVLGQIRLREPRGEARSANRALSARCDEAKSKTTTVSDCS